MRTCSVKLCFIRNYLQQLVTDEKTEKSWKLCLVWKTPFLYITLYNSTVSKTAKKPTLKILVIRLCSC